VYHTHFYYAKLACFGQDLPAADTDSPVPTPFLINLGSVDISIVEPDGPVVLIRDSQHKVYASGNCFGSVHDFARANVVPIAPQSGSQAAGIEINCGTGGDINEGEII
jgi:hypothetical protein